MQTPVQVTFRNLPVSDAVEDACLDEVAKLERYCDRITSCQVTVTEAHRHHRQGNLYEVRVLLRVPGEEIVVDRMPAAHHAAEDVYVVIRESFDKTRRQLEDYVRRHRGKVKVHPEPKVGRVARLLPLEECGFLATAEGRDVYFHRHSLLHGSFDDLEVGDTVEFVEEPGDKGPQAAAVTKVRTAPR